MAYQSLFLERLLRGELKHVSKPFSLFLYLPTSGTFFFYFSIWSIKQSRFSLLNENLRLMNWVFSKFLIKFLYCPGPGSSDFFRRSARDPDTILPASRYLWWIWAENWRDSVRDCKRKKRDQKKVEKKFMKHIKTRLT